MPYSIALIGLGAISRGHVQPIQKNPDLQLTALCDLDPERLGQAQDELGNRGYTDFRKLLEDPPDAVAVALPHGLHCEVAVAALEAGCHVIVEKPMAVSVDECRRMMAAAQKADRYLNVSEGSAYSAGPTRIGEMFRSGSLGRFFTGVFIHSRRYFHPNRPAWFLDPAMSGGGMFSNVGFHRLAPTSVCLSGLEPVRVSAAVMYVPEYQIEACTSALVHYDQGGAMHYEEVGYFSRPDWWPVAHHYIFEACMIRFEEDTLRMVQRSGAVIEEKLPLSEAGYDGVYADLVRGMRGEPIKGPGVRGFAVDTAIAQAAYTSGRRGGLEIDLRSAEWAI
jgi:predicted dehydrogenase